MPVQNRKFDYYYLDAINFCDDLFMFFFFFGFIQKPKACNFIKNETLAQVFPCEFCEISKYTFSILFQKNKNEEATKY